jgi:hypothetical protein
LSLIVRFAVAKFADRIRRLDGDLSLDLLALVERLVGVLENLFFSFRVVVSPRRDRRSSV